MLTFQFPVLPIQSTYSRPVSLTTSFFSDTLRFVNSKLSTLTFHPKPRELLIIRMGGGPRTYPGGVSKWQWKRMQAKKAKQLLKARLCRERQIYEMRKRAELKMAVSDLERPWEVVERAPTLFSVKADEQLKVLADRFQKPGGFDMWSEKDGPQLFQTVDGLPSARFFPKGVVHSIKPYAKFTEDDEDLGGARLGEGMRDYNGGSRRRRQLKEGRDEVSFDGEDSAGGESSLKLDVNIVEKKSGGSLSYKDGKKPNMRNNRPLGHGGTKTDKIGAQSRRKGIDSGSGQRHLVASGSGRREGLENTGPGRENKERRHNDVNEFRKTKGTGTGKSIRSKSDVHDMRLQQDGSYGF